MPHLRRETGRSSGKSGDFGDGSETVKTKTDGNVDPHNPAGYAVITHAYEKPGTYLVTVKCTNGRGETGDDAFGGSGGKIEPDAESDGKEATVAHHRQHNDPG